MGIEEQVNLVVGLASGLVISRVVDGVKAVFPEVQGRTARIMVGLISLVVIAAVLWYQGAEPSDPQTYLIGAAAWGLAVRSAVADYAKKVQGEEEIRHEVRAQMLNGVIREMAQGEAQGHELAMLDESPKT